MRYLIIALFVALLLSACAVNPVSGKRELAFLSEKNEISLGKQYHPQILQEYGIYDNPDLQNYVNNLGQELANISHRQNLIFRFTVLDSPVVNAFALPGGYIYITRGILSYLNSEAELAGVLGHEIGHVTAKHGVRQHRNQTLAGIGGILVASAADSKTISDLYQVFGGALISGYGRQNELQSDELGAEYLAKVGYNPNTMIDVITVLKHQEVFNQNIAKAEGREPQSYHGIFASHPKNDTRLKEVVKAAERYQNTQTKDAGVDQFLQATEKMIYGDSPQQGIIRNDQFLHPDLGITLTLPANWIIQNQAQQIILITPDQRSKVQITMDTLNIKTTPKAFLENSLKLRPQSSQPLALANLQAHTITTQLKTNQGSKPARVSAIFKDNNVYLITASSEDTSSFQAHDPHFLALAKNFHNMTETERQQAKPYRLKRVKAKPGTTYEALAKQSPLRKYSADKLRLINGHYPDKQPKAGQWVKIIE